MVEPVQPISATAPTAPTRIGSSTSIGSEPDNAWIAARQTQITADLMARAGREQVTQDRPQRQAEASPGEADAEIPGLPHHDPEHSHGGHHPHETRGSDALEASSHTEDDPLLSGESDRIGTVNFDDDTPFGHRTAII